MDSIHKNIKINLHMNILDHGQKEQHQQEVTGKLIRKGNIDVITYKEKMEENDEINNLITIQPKRITLKRSGSISMNQQFQQNQWTETTYKHPYGFFYMETYTKEIAYRTEANGCHGSLHIFYTVKLNGQNAREHQWLLTFKEEEDK